MSLHYNILLYLYPFLSLIRNVGIILRFVTPNRVRVLIYHDVPANQEEAFEKQMRWLKKKWNIISPLEFEAMLTGDAPIIGDNLLITFDDGLISNRVIAENILNPLGVKAIFFVVSDFVKIKYTSESKIFIAKHIMPGTTVSEVPDSWGNMQLSDLSALIDEGHTIGFHTKQHTRLSECSSESKLVDELITSSEYLSNKLGVKINHFAYTFGDVESFSEAALVVAKSKFRFIYTGLRGNNVKGTSPLAIRRDAAAYQVPNNEYRLFNNRLLNTFLGGFADFRYKISRKIIDSWCR